MRQRKMNSNDFRKLAYCDYVTSHHNSGLENIKEFLKVRYRYFNYNYSKYLPENKAAKILDIGCGKGDFLHFLRKKGYKNSIGIDLSHENLAICRKFKLTCYEANAFKFLKKGTMYSAIIMNDIIEHLNKTEVIPLLKLVKSRLVDGGILIIKVPNAGNPFLAPHSLHVDITHEQLYSKESLEQILKLSGFRSLLIIPTHVYIFWYNPLNYLGWFIAFCLNLLLRFIFILYGRKNPAIFTKDIIAVAKNG